MNIGLDIITTISIIGSNNWTNPAEIYRLRYFFQWFFLFQGPARWVQAKVRVRIGQARDLCGPVESWVWACWRKDSLLFNSDTYIYIDLSQIQQIMCQIYNSKVTTELVSTQEQRDQYRKQLAVANAELGKRNVESNSLFEECMANILNWRPSKHKFPVQSDRKFQKFTSSRIFSTVFYSSIVICPSKNQI